MEDNLLANIQTKKRSANFTKSEMDRLQAIIGKHKMYYFVKKTDGISSKQKDSAWTLIECEFNALGDTPRTVKQLIYKFENLKRVAKNAASKERRTGGGPPPPPLPGLEDATDWLRSIIQSSIDGNEAIYDDDALSQKTVIPPKKLMKDITIEIVDECITEKPANKIPANEINLVEVNEASASNEKWDFDTTTPYSSLKRPVSSPLRRNA